MGSLRLLLLQEVGAGEQVFVEEVEVEEIDESIGVVLDDAGIDEEIEEELTPEEVVEVKKEIQREINNQAIRQDGWLDDVDTNTNK